MSRAGCGLLAFKRSYVDLDKQFDGEGTDARQKSKVGWGEGAGRYKNVEKIILKIQLLANVSENLASLQAQVSAREVKPITMRMAASSLAESLEAMARVHASLQLKLDAL